jgi:hypothetical protein
MCMVVGLFINVFVFLYIVAQLLHSDYFHKVNLVCKLKVFGLPSG